MEADLKQIIFLFLFIVIGVALFVPILSLVNNLTTPYYTKVNGTTTQTIANPNYVGSTNAPLVSLVPLFYILVLLIVPAVVAYKMYKERE